MNPRTFSLIMIFFLLIALFSCVTDLKDPVEIKGEPISEIENLDAPDIVIEIPIDANLTTARLFGNTTDKIINPKSVSIERLIKANEKFEIANKANNVAREAKREIYITMAQASVIASLEKYHKEYLPDTVIFKEEDFFIFLKTQPAYTNKTGDELRLLFDITDNIIAEIQKENAQKGKQKTESQPITNKPSIFDFDD